jgi:hypothetical protein
VRLSELNHRCGQASSTLQTTQPALYVRTLRDQKLTLLAVQASSANDPCHHNTSTYLSLVMIARHRWQKILKGIHS